jgi:hypothetical protein
MRRKISANLNGIVGTIGIDCDDFIHPRYRVESFTNVPFFIEHDNRARNRLMHIGSFRQI